MRLLLLFLTWLALTIIGLSRLSFNVEVAGLLPPELPEARGIQQLYDHFGREDELIVVLEAADAATASRSAASLAHRLSQADSPVRAALWHLPFEENPELAADLLAWFWFNGPPAALQTLEQRLSPEVIDETLAETLEELASGFLEGSTLLRSYDPLGFTNLPGGLRESAGLAEDDRLFASPDGLLRLLYLQAPPGEFENYRETAAWIASIRQEIATWREAEAIPTEVTTTLTGEPAFVAEISTAMERDMKGSAIATTALIALLFWLWYRRLRPLLWLLLMLGLVFSGTFAVGGVLFGELTAMSIGFAAILLGLAVDYGVVLYRERDLAPGDPAALRRRIGPSIGWAAATTAVVFATLNLASLPGIAELGSLVAIGTIIGAGVMLGLFAPVAARDAAMEQGKSSQAAAAAPSRPESPRLPIAFTFCLVLAGVLTAIFAGPPGLKREAKPFQLRESESFTALATMENALRASGSGNSLPDLPVIIPAGSWSQLSERLAAAETKLRAAREAGSLRDFLLPSTLVPHPRNQAANRQRIADLAAQADRLVTAIAETGFRDEAAALTLAITDSWGKLLENPPHSENGETWVLPDSHFSRWLIGRAVSHPGPGDFAAAGTVSPSSLAPDAEGHLPWTRDLEKDGILVTGWEVLDPALQALVTRDFQRVFLPMGLLLVVMLAVVFRNARDLLLALASLAFSGLSLMTLSRWLPSIEWNTFNLAALPILFGTGLDYAIHMIFALRRSGGDLVPVRRGITQALLFCGGSTAIGFGSLSFAASEGLASLGLVCALGILLNLLAAIWLLPHWWRWSHRRSAS